MSTFSVNIIGSTVTDIYQQRERCNHALKISNDIVSSIVFHLENCFSLAVHRTASKSK